MKNLKRFYSLILFVLCVQAPASAEMGAYMNKARFLGPWQLRSRVCIIPQENNTWFRRVFPKMDEFRVIPKQNEVLILTADAEAVVATPIGEIQFVAEYAILNNGSHLAFRDLPSETYLRPVMRVDIASFSRLRLRSKSKDCEGYVQSTYVRYVNEDF